MYPIHDLGDVKQELMEPLGTKPKFWFTHSDGRPCLCKLVRPSTGEDWSEVVSAEIASLMDLPHAEYNLAVYKGERAVFTPTVVPPFSELVLGNELLPILIPGYDSHTKEYRRPEHKVSAVFSLLEIIHCPPNWNAPKNIHNAADLFVGYLALDALVGNTDRHDENWGVIGRREINQVITWLAPTFDHASSLGCHETEEKKLARLETRDRNFSCRMFAAKARSGLYGDNESVKPLLTIEAFQLAVQKRPVAGTAWLEAVGTISEQTLAILLEQVPPTLLSAVSRRFALEMLKENRRRIVNLSVA